MCLACSDETAYRVFMGYLDAMERQGRTPDPDEAIKAILDGLQAAEAGSADDPRNDRTLSPFFCSAVDK